MEYFASRLASERRFDTKAVTWHYVFALGIIAILALVGLAATMLSLRAYETNIRVTQLGNDQLRLFQQTGELTRSFLQAASDQDATSAELDQIRRRILAATAQMRGNHEELQGLDERGLAAFMTGARARQFYNEKPHELSRRLNEFIQQAEFIAGAETATLRAGLADWAPIVLSLARHGAMIRGFDVMMAAFAEQGERQISLLKAIMSAATALIIITLIVEGWLIFRPLVRKLEAEHEKLSQSETHLNYLAHHDALTGLANRAQFQTALDSALARASVIGSQVTLLLIDLDKFKAVNDTYGHLAGDALLIAIGERLKNWSRGSDLATRLGGDEFAVILTGLKQPGQAQAVAERLREALTQPVRHEGIALQPYCSIGCASYPADAETAAQLIAQADRAMYSAKSRAAGVCVYQPSLVDDASGAAEGRVP